MPVAPANPCEAIRVLTIPDGRLIQVLRSENPTMTQAQGDALTGLPPRTMVTAILHPARGSTIRAEIWLPDADRWTGRFVGLGNGGSAGGIDPRWLGMQVAAMRSPPPTWAPRRIPIPASATQRSGRISASAPPI